MIAYLDHNATSPLLPEVLDAMRPWLGVPANPASVHGFGQRAAVAVERAREQVAALVGGNPAGVVFTSGATEANHLGLRGLAPDALALSRLEHPCVIAAAEVLRGQGTAIGWLPVGADGRVDLSQAPTAGAVALMAANHETGVVQPVEALLGPGVALERVVHVDATQAAGRSALDLQRASTVALSSHKLGGPGGVGALVLPDGDPFPAQLTGGSQERGRRAGTVNVAGAVGFGAACALALRELDARRERWAALRGRLEEHAVALGARVVGAGAERIPNTSCLVFPGVPGELLVQVLDLRGVAASHGAACASGSLDPSPVLLAMGEPEPEGAVRFSLGPRTTPAEVDHAVDVLRAVVPELRGE